VFEFRVSFDGFLRDRNLPPLSGTSLDISAVSAVFQLSANHWCAFMPLPGKVDVLASYALPEFSRGSKLDSSLSPVGPFTQVECIPVPTR